MDANDATRIIGVVDRRIQKHVGSMATTETTWGEVCGISADGKFASAYLYGETEVASEDFRIPGDLALSLGDKVKVAWNARGERWVYDVAVASEYKKVAINPNTGEILTGDGTVPPTPLAFEHDHDTFDGSSVQTDTLGVALDAQIDGNLTLPGGSIEMEGENFIEPDGAGGLILRNGAPAGENTQLMLTGEVDGDARYLGFKRVKTDSQPALRIGYTSTGAPEIWMGEGGESAMDVRLYRTGPDALGMNSGDRLDLQAVGRGVYRSTSISIATGVWTKVTGYTSTADILGLEASHNATRDTIEIAQDGVYLIVLFARILTAVADQRASIGFRVANNADVTGTSQPTARHMSLVSTASAQNFYLSAAFIEPLVALDNVAMIVWHDSGVSKSFDAFTMRVIRLGTE